MSSDIFTFSPLSVRLKELRKHMHPDSMVHITSSPRACIKRGIFDDKRVILKALLVNSETSETGNDPFEYWVMRRLSSPNVVSPICWFSDPLSQCKIIVMEDGGDSVPHISDSWDTAQFDRLLDISSQIANGLAVVHDAGIIHRDICPSNLVYNSVSKVAKIVDFHLASLMPMMQHARKNGGTIAYVSPEQTGLVNRQTDYRTDLYSFGVTLYELFTGTNPFLGADDFDTLHNHVLLSPKQVSLLRPGLPSSISRVIEKLLAKSPEGRYQSARALKYDLGLIRQRYRDESFNSEFVPGLKDSSNMFLISQEFVGRESECSMIIDAIDRVRANGCETVFIEGRSGIGKSALVEQISIEIARMKGFFLSGKYQKANINVDFSGIVLALGSFVVDLIEQTKDYPTLRSELISSLGDNAGLLCEFAPKMVNIFGSHVLEGFTHPNPDESMRRLRLGIRNFFECVANPENPLVFFLDDLQWMDSRSVVLIEYLFGEAGLKNVLFIGSYRDNEVVDGSECSKLLANLKEKQVRTEVITIEALSIDDVSRLISETIRLPVEKVADLTSLIYAKSMGNPFFVKSLLNELYRLGLMRQVKGSWYWELERIENMDIREDVSTELRRIMLSHDPVCIHILDIIACCSPTTSFCSRDLICTVAELETSVVDQHLGELLCSYLIIYCHTHFKCAHDGILETVFANMDPERKKVNEYNIGRYLKSRVTDKRNASMAVEYFGNSVELVKSPTEALEVAELALIAARDAKISTSFGSCKSYLDCGIKCLGENAWDDHYELCFSLYCSLVEVEYILESIDESRRLGNMVFDKARTSMDKARVSKWLVLNAVMRGATLEACNIGKDALELLGVIFPRLEEKIEEAVEDEMSMVEENLEGRSFDELLTLGEMKDERLKLVMDLLRSIDPPLYLRGDPSYSLVVARMANFTLKYGIHPFGSPKGFVTYGALLGKLKGLYTLGGGFAILGLRISDKLGLKSERCAIYSNYYGWLKHWTQPLYSPDDEAAVALQMGKESGDVQFVNYTRMTMCLKYFYLGKDLPAFLDQIPVELHELKQPNCVDTIRGMYLILCTLVSCPYRRELRIVCPEFSEEDYLIDSDDENRKFSLGIYFSMKAKMLFLLGEFERALDAANVALNDMDFFVTCLGLFETAELSFYHALILFSLLDSKSNDIRAAYLRQIDEYIEKFGLWTQGCKENFLHRYMLLKAELANVKSEFEEAVRSFQSAIGLSRKGDFFLDCAVAHERFGMFWFANGLKASAKGCINDSYAQFRKINLVCKLQQMEAAYGSFLDRRQKAPLQRLSLRDDSSSKKYPSVVDADIDSISKAARVLFGEKNTPAELLASTMGLLLKNSGANRGVLCLVQDDELFVKAVCDLSESYDHPGDNISIPISDAISICCVELIQECANARTAVVVTDARTDEKYQKNSFCRKNQCRSMLSLPIINQAELLGILFLENRSMPGCFSSDILSVLTLIVSQLAVSLIITSRFTLLAQMNGLLKSSEQRFRALVDSAPVGIIRLDARRRPIYMNEMFTEITGLNSDNFELLWKDVIQSDYRNHVFDTTSEDSFSEHLLITEEMRIVTVGGLSKWINFYIAPLFSEEKHEFDGSIVIVVDISSLKFLDSAIPKEIVAKMAQKPSLSPHQHAKTVGNATIMFADIAGFTLLSEKIVPQRFTELLNQVFSEYDELIYEFDLTRLKVIGECYMVVGGILQNSVASDHCMRMAKLALRMREISFKHAINDDPIRLRIGICNGPIAAGVIGTKKLVFDVWGRIVNTAKRLQESCEIDDICMFSELGSSLKTDLVVGPESLKQITDVGPVLVRCILGDKLMLRRIVYALLVRLHEYFPLFVEKHSDTFDELLQSLVVPAMIGSVDSCCTSSSSFISQHSQPASRPRRLDYLPESLYSDIQMIDFSSTDNIDQELSNHMSILHLSIILNCEDAVRWCLYMHVCQRSMPGGIDPFILATKYASLSIIKLLLPQRKKYDGSNEWSPLFVASAFGRTSIVRQYLDWNFADNSRECCGMSPLTVAAMYGHEDVVRLLSGRMKHILPMRSICDFVDSIVNHKSGFFLASPELSRGKIETISWIMSRGSKEATVFQPHPFRATAPAAAFHESDLHFLFSEYCSNPTILLRRNGKSLLLDCATTSFPTVLQFPNYDVIRSDFCITNIHGSNGKGLEPHAFARYFLSDQKHKSKVYIPEAFLKPLWEGSLAGGLCSIEGIKPSFTSFLDVKELARKDCFEWGGVRIWLIPTTETGSSCAILFTVNDQNIIINPDRESSLSLLGEYYDEADAIFINLSCKNTDLDWEQHLLRYPQRHRQKMWVFGVEPDDIVIRGRYVRGICPRRKGENDIVFNLNEKIEHEYHDLSFRALPDIVFATTRKPSCMELFFIGSGTAFGNNNTNAILTIDGQRLLIDCGGTYYSAAKKVGINPLDINAVFISHLHCDHVGGLVDLVLCRRRFGIVDKLRLFVSAELVNPIQPTKSLWENTLKTPLGFFEGKERTLSDFFDVCALSVDESLDWYGLSIQLVKMDHIKDYDLDAPTHGIMARIEKPNMETYGKKILITTDTKVIPDVDQYCKPADLIFHDCSFVPNVVHTGLDELRRLPSAIQRKIWLIHTGNTQENVDVASFRGIVSPGQHFDFASLSTFRNS